MRLGLQVPGHVLVEESILTLDGTPFSLHPLCHGGFPSLLRVDVGTTVPTIAVVAVSCNLARAELPHETCNLGSHLLSPSDTTGAFGGGGDGGQHLHQVDGVGGLSFVAYFYPG
ncbi:hypothetical protein H257_09283 [Aphanomyces astaci]|uniref:Uncharacterized protein n=1 Tax=Aphanomyces astaci TaxID=112090 RepID=W4GC23_APHAT|nr:hypothetical protein H257_09283 [Aphanomyces astaci]ETV76841.1 hypothetical protein H257_09283 [Aphanomyces astaci]|eukprot:XP_009833753.1 hypothetical protein H257_09283 [Aphanomyces astaci]